MVIKILDAAGNLVRRVVMGDTETPQDKTKRRQHLSDLLTKIHGNVEVLKSRDEATSVVVAQLQERTGQHGERIAKLETEISTIRKDIEKMPERLSCAVDNAKKAGRSC